MKNPLLLVFVLMSSQAICFAQSKNAEKYAATITTHDLKKHLTIIAGDEMEGRETGTPGQRKAATYIEKQFKLLGLKAIPALKGYQQLYPLYKDSLVSSELTIDGKATEFGKDYYCQSNISETGTFTGSKIILVGYGIDDTNYSDYTGMDVAGKIVLFFSGEPKKEGKYLVSGTTKSSEWSYPGTEKKLATAAAKGAVGALVINTNQATFLTRIIEANRKSDVYYPRNASDVKKVNHAFLSHAFAASIFNNQFDSLLKIAKTGKSFDKGSVFEKQAASHLQYVKNRIVINASNILGIIEGSDKKDEFVFLTAHYDHLGKQDGKIYYGADDDGSGTCAVIEMAEAFTKAKVAGHGPRRTMVFMTVSGEEKGLWGSEYYGDHPVFPLEKTSVDLNTDMVGRIDTERIQEDSLNYVYVIGHDKLSSELQLINEGVNNRYTQLVFDYKYDDPNDQNRIYYRSDHYNFAKNGVPILFFYDGMLKSDYHQPTDTVDKIYWDLYEKRVKMIFHTAWEIANRDEMLKRDIPLGNGTR
jgi:Zn-dependent M28 family amino/carboxypeptidase